MGENPSKPMHGVRRALALVDYLSSKEKASSFSELRQALDNLAAPTLSRILNTLIEEAWVEKESDTGLYVLGSGAHRFGVAVNRSMTVGELVEPVLTKLSAETGQTAAYYENTVDGVMIVAKVEHEESVHMRAVRDPINRLSHNEFGQICLAYRSEADWKRFYDIEPRSDMSFDEFKVHLNEIRKRGYLIEGTSHASWTRVTAPVFYGVGGGFAGAIGVTRPVVFSQINDLAFYRDLVVRAAHAATERLKVKESVLS